jgi:hypothetical protein
MLASDGDSALSVNGQEILSQQFPKTGSECNWISVKRIQSANSPQVTKSGYKIDSAASQEAKLILSKLKSKRQSIHRLHRLPQLQAKAQQHLLDQKF